MGGTPLVAEPDLYVEDPNLPAAHGWCEALFHGLHCGRLATIYISGPPFPGGGGRMICDVHNGTEGTIAELAAVLVFGPARPVKPERAGREGDSQPMPTPNDHPDVQSAVIADIEARRELGIRRYGTALQPFNGRRALVDLYEELLDAAMYAKQGIIEDVEWRQRAERLADLVLAERQARVAMTVAQSAYPERLNYEGAMEVVHAGNAWDAAYDAVTVAVRAIKGE